MLMEEPGLRLSQSDTQMGSPSTGEAGAVCDWGLRVCRWVGSNKRWLVYGYNNYHHLWSEFVILICGREENASEVAISKMPASHLLRISSFLCQELDGQPAQDSAALALCCSSAGTWQMALGCGIRMTPQHQPVSCLLMFLEWPILGSGNRASEALGPPSLKYSPVSNPPPPPTHIVHVLFGGHVILKAWISQQFSGLDNSEQLYFFLFFWTTSFAQTNLKVLGKT